MANFTTVRDILTDALFKANITSTRNAIDSGDPYFQTALVYINEVHLSLRRGNAPLTPNEHVNFRWAVKHPQSSFVMPVLYEEGTVELNVGSDSAVFSQGVPESRVGWHLIPEQGLDVYRIIAHEDGSDTMQLDSVFTGDNTTGDNFRLVKVEFTLGNNDIERLVEPMRVHRKGLDIDDYVVGEQGPKEFVKDWPLSRVAGGVPSRFKILREDDGNIIIQTNRYAEDEMIKVEYDYIDIAQDLTIDDIPSVPRSLRSVMTYWVTALLLEDKNDNKAPRFFNLAQNAFQTVAQDQDNKKRDATTRFGKLSPRQSYRSRRRRLEDIINVRYD